MSKRWCGNVNSTSERNDQTFNKLQAKSMRFLSNFRRKIIFIHSVNFWHQQDSNSLFKGSVGHVTSLCKWPILLQLISREAKSLNSVKWKMGSVDGVENSTP